LLQHLGDAGADHVALVAQHRQFGILPFRLVEAGAQVLDVLQQPGVVLRRLRLLRAKLRDQTHEQLDLLFETINRFEIGHRSRHCRLRHPLSSSR
jgi:hypothetical protein